MIDSEEEKENLRMKITRLVKRLTSRVNKRITK